MSMFYEIEVHYLDYDTVGVTAESEEEAHEMARVIYQTMHDRIIGVAACATVAVNREEVDNDGGEHTTEWM